MKTYPKSAVIDLTEDEPIDGIPVRASRRFTVALVVAGLALLVGACSSTLQMQVRSEVPEPVVDRLPIHIAVFYPDELRRHTFVENSEDRGEWRIETGPAQVAMFEKILPAVYSHTQQVSQLRVPDDMAVDAILSPTLERMELALPEETQFEFYEAWLRYKMRLLDRRGKLIAEWKVTGYGKVNSAGALSSREQNLNAAINAALRDAGGQLALGFQQQEAVRDWLCQTETMTENNLCNLPPSA